MMQFILVLIILSTSMILMTVGLLFSRQPLERGCGRSVDGHCSCRANLAPGRALHGSCSAKRVERSR